MGSLQTFSIRFPMGLTESIDWLIRRNEPGESMKYRSSSGASLVPFAHFFDDALGDVRVDRRADVGAVVLDHVQSANQFLLGVGLQNVASRTRAKGAATELGGRVQS